MDPSHKNNRMNMFTRFCINTDVVLNVRKKIIIPDDNCNPLKYKLWFDDFLDGCGACGLTDHVFKECLNRAIPISILKITIRKQSSTKPTGHASTASSSLNEDWLNIGKNNKILHQHHVYLKYQNKPYLAQNSRANFVYESGESDEMLILDPKLDLELDSQPHLIFASDGINFNDEYEAEKDDGVVNNNRGTTNSGDSIPYDQLGQIMN
ncbi:hypothetical protein V2J09_002349 [Rumex salicifolius]